ncbi:hypothetical protein D3C79_848840 [compost metagenome]
MHFHAIEPRVHGVSRGNSVLLDNTGYLVSFQRARCGHWHETVDRVGIALGPDRRGCYRCLTVRLQFDA